MRKIRKHIIKNINGTTLNEPIVIDIYYLDSGKFACFLNEDVLSLIPESEKSFIRSGRSKTAPHTMQLIGTSEDNLVGKIWTAYNDYYSQNIIEEKLIEYRVKYNSEKTYFNHDQRISFADSPAISFWWEIRYLITMPDGRKKVFTAPYKDFGNLCSNKATWDYDVYCKKFTSLEWSEERELFFKNTELAMEGMIKQITSFFGQPKLELESKIDNGVKMLN